MCLTITAATGADLEDLLPLVSAYRRFYQRPHEPQRERAFIAGHVEKGTSTIFIARVDNEAVGFTQLFRTYNTVWRGPSLILEDLFVDPSTRRDGIATKLLGVR